MRRTKIICTLGPASNSEEMIEKLLRAGMNVMRLNFSHGNHKDHKKLIERFRKVRDELGVPAAVLLDTKGPEIRLKSFENGSAEIVAGSTFTLTSEDVVGNSEMASITWAPFPGYLHEGDRIVIDDGRIVLQVRQANRKKAVCDVITGGVLKDKKSVNVPNVDLPMEYLSDADREDLLFGIKQEVDFVAASFVRSGDDVREIRAFLRANGGRNIKVISKIENSEGVRNFDEILSLSDGIMVARGDLGVEVPFAELPGLQKQFIHRCYSAGKMVITATQMLESMITNPTPTRAEITDVANAVFDGTSAVMLSGESAVGAYPEEAVKTLVEICTQAENDAFRMKMYKALTFIKGDKEDITNAVCDAACITAHDLSCAAIIAITQSGGTARNVSKYRPQTPIIAATPEKRTYHQLSLSWGVIPVMTKYQRTSDELLSHAVDCAKKNGYVTNGDCVVTVAGIPLATTGSTNLLKVQIVGEKN